MAKGNITFTDSDVLNLYSYPVVFSVTTAQQKPLIPTGNGTQIGVAPGWKLTVSADPDGDGVFTNVLTTNISGITKYNPDGTQTYNGPALNLNFVDTADVPIGYYIQTGHHTFSVDDGLSVGHGPLINLDAFL